MTERKFTKFELARMKRTAQNVDQYLNKKNKLVAKMKELQTELDGIIQLIEITDAPTKAMTGGYGTEDIIKKVITLTDKLDKNGNVLKLTSYEFLYPETIIPPTTTKEGVEDGCKDVYCEPTDIPMEESVETGEDEMFNL